MKKIAYSMTSWPALQVGRKLIRSDAFAAYMRERGYGRWTIKEYRRRVAAVAYRLAEERRSLSSLRRDRVPALLQRYLTDGDPAYTLVQVAVNDLIMLVAFAPIVMFLCGVAHVVVPTRVLVTSVIVFIVIPLAAGWLTRSALLRSKGREWFEREFLPKFHPVMIGALLLTLILIFAYQAENLATRWFMVLLIAVPITLQVYFNSGLTYLLMRALRVEHSVAAPGSLIGASNFFELAVAVAIALFGPGSSAALATVVGVLVEVPVMLSICRVCNVTRPWYESRP